MRQNYGCWIKIFDDNTKEHGSDSDIQAGKASWSQGRLNNIKEVLLFDNGFMIELSIPNTDWYQFDRYLAAVAIGKNVPERTHRVIQAEIKKHHVGNLLVGSIKNHTLFCYLINKDDKKEYDFKVQIEEQHISKWISVVLSKHKRKMPIVLFGDKGKIQWPNI